MSPAKKPISKKRSAETVKTPAKKKIKGRESKTSSSASNQSKKSSLVKAKIKVRIAGEDFKFKNNESKVSNDFISADENISLVNAPGKQDEFAGAELLKSPDSVGLDKDGSGDDYGFDDDSDIADKTSPVQVDSSSVADDKVDKSVARPIGLYKKISFFFIFLTIILVLGVLYLALVSVSIVITPQSERISEKLIINIFDQSKNQANDFSGPALAGEVAQVDVSQEKTYPATGEEVLGRQITGKVTIFNTTGSNQPLVATTRLLTQDDKLFRIHKTVTVPANGEVEVDIYADDPNEEMAIAPTSFTIPGLWAGLQDKIYGESSEKFVFSKQIKTYVQQKDIDNGVDDLKKELIASVSQQYGGDYKGNDHVIYEIDNNSIEIELGAKADEEVNSFSIKISAVVRVVAFKSLEVEQNINDKLLSVIPADKKLLNINSGGIEYSLSNYNLKQGVATIESSFSGTVVFNNTEELIDKKKLIGLSEDQIINFLEAEGKFEKFEIKFFPAFIKKAPQLVDKIKIKISE